MLINYVPYQQLGDTVGEATARMNVSDLRKMLGLPELTSDDNDSIDEVEIVLEPEKSESQSSSVRDSSSRLIRVRRQSMEQLDLIKVYYFLLFYLQFFSSVPEQKKKVSTISLIFISIHSFLCNNIVNSRWQESKRRQQ